MHAHSNCSANKIIRNTIFCELCWPCLAGIITSYRALESGTVNWGLKGSSRKSGNEWDWESKRAALVQEFKPKGLGHHPLEWKACLPSCDVIKGRHNSPWTLQFPATVTSLLTCSFSCSQQGIFFILSLQYYRFFTLANSATEFSFPWIFECMFCIIYKHIIGETGGCLFYVGIVKLQWELNNFWFSVFLFIYHWFSMRYSLLLWTNS